MEKIKGPEFRIVGGASEEAKQEAKEELLGFFGENHLGDVSEKELLRLERLEYKKFPEELEMINFANKKSSELMEKCGVDSYDVPDRNFHIVSQELFKEVGSKHDVAITIQRKQIIAMNADNVRKKLMSFGKISFHELLHLKSHFAAEVEEVEKDDEVRIFKKTYREGVGVFSSQKKDIEHSGHEHFAGLNEAIVASQEKQFVEDLLELPMFSEEKNWVKSEKFLKLREKISKEENIPIDEIYQIDKDGKGFNTFSYPKQRAVFDYLVGEICKDTGKTEEEIRLEFLKAQFTGKLLSIAHLTEETFGKGSFRALGNMKDDRLSAVLCLEELRKMRLNKNK